MLISETKHPKQFSAHDIRKEFPILATTAHGHPLTFLDNAATTQKPQSVIDTLTQYYTSMNANVHRGVHHLSELSTAAYESTRTKIQKFLNAASTQEIIFTRGTTDAINLVAQTFGRANIQQHDEIIISAMEHHSNIVPWQLLCEQTGAKLKIIPMNDRGELDADTYQHLFSNKTKLVALMHISNALGTINPIKSMITKAHEHNVPVLIDGAQAVSHFPVDVQDLDCDFYAFSAHKLYGPTGVGVLYGKKALLNAMPPYQGGGEMISQVSFEKTTYNELPYKFEAGTPNIAGVIGLATAIDFVNNIGFDVIKQHEQQLFDYAVDALQSVPDIQFIGTAAKRTGVISFLLGDIHAHDVGTILDHQGVAIRSGHHCAMPVMEFFNVPATVRASFAIYNTTDDIDKLIQGLHETQKVFS